MEQEPITGMKISGTVRLELAVIMRWTKVQLVLGALLQLVMLVFAVRYVSFFYRFEHTKTAVAGEYLRIALWMIFNVGAYAYLLMLMVRYIRSMQQALNQDNQLAFLGTFKYVKKATIANCILLLLSVVYYSWTLAGLIKLF